MSPKFLLWPCRFVPWGDPLATWPADMATWEGLGDLESRSHLCLSGSSITCPKLNNHLIFPPKPVPPLLTSSPQLSSSFTSLQPHCPPCASLNTAGSYPRTFALAIPSTWKWFFLRHTHGWLSHLLQVFTQCHHVNEAKPGHHPRSHPSPAVFPQQLPPSTTLCDFYLFIVYCLPSSIRIKVAQAMVESR